MRSFAKQVYFKSANEEILCSRCVLQRRGEFEQVTKIKEDDGELIVCQGCLRELEKVWFGGHDRLEIGAFLHSAGIIRSPDTVIEIKYKITLEGNPTEEPQSPQAASIHEEESASNNPERQMELEQELAPFIALPFFYVDDLVGSALSYTGPTIEETEVHARVAEPTIEEIEEEVAIDYNIENIRLQTFINWPNELFHPARLSAAGFIYTGIRDQTVCPFCGLRQEGWSYDSHPLITHMFWSGRCAFVIANTDRINTLLNSMSDDTRINTLEQELVNNFEATDWPVIDHNIDVQGVIDQLELEEEEEEEEVLKEKEHPAEEDGESDNEDIQTELACKVCLTRELKTIFRPCNHVACCKRCASMSETCPICRTKITNYTIAFVA